MFGDILVVQPEIIFNPASSASNLTSNSATETEIVPLVYEDQVHNADYLLGVCLCLYAAASVSAANIVQVKVTGSVKEREVEESVGRINSNHLMIASGVWNVILSVSSLPLLPNTLLSSPGSMSSVSVTMLLVSSVLTLLAVWSMVTAVSLTQHPTLVSMIRSTEICISLVTESLYWGHLPNYLSALGSLLVMFCVVGISTHDNIMSAVSKIKINLACLETSKPRINT